MLQDYLPLIIIFVIAVALAFLVVGLGMAFGPRRPTQRKAAPYESAWCLMGKAGGGFPCAIT